MLPGPPRRDRSDFAGRYWSPGRAGGAKRATYSDTFDRQNPTNDSAAAWSDYLAFISHEFERLRADRSFPRTTVLNVGAGKTVVDYEAAFFRQFGRVLLMEPDDERRSALGEHPDAVGAQLLSDRIQEVDPGQLPSADFFLCAWVLQHLPTDEVGSAVANLRALCSARGSVGIFTAYSEQPFFLLKATPQVVAELPEWLRPDSHKRLTERQYNHLIENDDGMEFIATHHLDRTGLLELFEGWETSETVASPHGLMFLQASRPS